MKGLDVVRAARHAGRGLFNALAELGCARLSPPDDPGAAARRLSAALETIARAHVLVVTVKGAIPRHPALVVANHVSYLDPLAILPKFAAAPLAKGEVMSWPVIGPIGAALGVTFVQRDDPASRIRALRRIHHLLASGVSVLNFPEGTTTRGTEVLPFWRGTFGIARRLGVPVVPVAIRYRDPALAWCDGATFMPHYLGVAARPHVEVQLSFLPALSARTGECAEDMAQRARDRIARALHTTRFDDATTSDPLSTARSNSVLPARRVG